MYKPQCQEHRINQVNWPPTHKMKSHEFSEISEIEICGIPTYTAILGIGDPDLLRVGTIILMAECRGVEQLIIVFRL